MRGLLTILLLVASNTFMTMAWYGHLKFKEWGWFTKAGIFTIILISWGFAFFEYCFQVPANRLGFLENGGPYSMVQLKVIQEVITLVVFTIFLALVSKKETMQWNHLVAFALLIGAVYFVFKK
ncbi:MAG: DMT family protein [Bacteroidetes bacterium]|nr:DMT family protein [Bacteroidota bacterium]